MKVLTDRELVTKLKSYTQEERRLTSLVLEYLQEVDRRRLYADYGCSSLWEFCVKELKYTEGAAARRIHSMRLLREVPDLKHDIVAGTHSLMSLAQAQVFFRAEQRQHGIRFSTQQKIKVLKRLENKSARECARELELLATNPKPRIQYVEVNEELITKLMRIRELRSHAQPAASDAELLHYIADEFLKRADPTRKQPPKRKLPPALKPVSQPKRQAIPLAVRRQVWQRDNGRCTACGTRHFLELDHIRPVSRNGTNNLENLRLRCRAHNHRAAIKMGIRLRWSDAPQLRSESIETTSPLSQTTENSMGLQQT